MRLIDADALTDKVDKYIYRITRASKRKLKVGESAILADIKAHIELSPTIDAVPLDGSFLKMSKGDYLIYNRHWLYEHFDMEMDIQRSAMKSMGYERGLTVDTPTVDAKPHWIPCSERLPKDDTEVLISYRYKEGEGDTDHVNIDITSYGTTCFGGREIHTLKEWRQPFDYFHANYEVIAWMPLPEPYEVEDEKTD